MDKKEFIKIFNNELKKHKFIKKGYSWYLFEEKVIKVVNLQKSQYSNLYYVNLCVFFKDLEKTDFPKEEHCHIRTRLDNYIIQSDIDYNHLFDLEIKDISYEYYEEELKKCITVNILPQLNIIQNKEGILSIISKMPSFKNTIPMKVKKYLNIV